MKKTVLCLAGLVLFATELSVAQQKYRDETTMEVVHTKYTSLLSLGGGLARAGGFFYADAIGGRQMFGDSPFGWTFALVGYGYGMPLRREIDLAPLKRAGFRDYPDKEIISNQFYIFPLGLYALFGASTNATLGIETNLSVGALVADEHQSHFYDGNMATVNSFEFKPRDLWTVSSSIGLLLDLPLWRIRLAYDMEWLHPGVDIQHHKWTYVSGHFYETNDIVKISQKLPIQNYISLSVRFNLGGFGGDGPPIGSLNPVVEIKRRIPLANPSLVFEKPKAESDRTFISGERKEMKVVLRNVGDGIAEGMNVRIAKGNASLAAATVPRLGPRSSKTIVFPLRFSGDRQTPEQLGLSLSCVEKDGFRADDNLQVTVLPASALEKFPPVLALTANLIEPSGNRLLDANEIGEIELAVSNRGKGSAWNVELGLELKSRTRVPGLTLNQKPLTIRQIKPQATQSVRVPISATMEIPSTRLDFSISAKEANGFDPPPLGFSFGTQAFIPPDLVITDVGIDDSEGPNSMGNGDRKIQNNETVETGIVIQNRGQGIAEDVTVTVHVADKNIILSNGENRFSLGQMKPGEHKIVRFPIIVNNRYAGNSALPISVTVDESLKKYGVARKNLGLALNKVTRASKDIRIEGRPVQPVAIGTAPTVEVDIEEGIPASPVANEDGVGVVIGISRYQRDDVPPVEYARRDAQTMREYLVKTLGYDQRRIIEYYDHEATGNAFRKVAEEQLRNYVRAGRSDVFFYYSGHGVPDPGSQEAYFVPYDCDPQFAKSTGYAVKELYSRLSRLPARKVTVVLDACFSGSSPSGTLLKQVSPAYLSPESPASALTNGLVFASASGGQLSNWFAEKKHGLFTYYFLSALRGKADLNNDHEITAYEIEKYLLDNVPDQARYLHNREQTPQVSGTNKQQVVVKLR